MVVLYVLVAFGDRQWCGRLLVGLCLHEVEEGQRCGWRQTRTHRVLRKASHTSGRRQKVGVREEAGADGWPIQGTIVYDAWRKAMIDASPRSRESRGGEIYRSCRYECDAAADTTCSDQKAEDTLLVPSLVWQQCGVTHAAVCCVGCSRVGGSK